MSTRKSIIPIDPVDIGGIQPLAEEMVSGEVIGYLTHLNLNPSLLSEEDPLKDDYIKFLKDLGNNAIVITNADIDTGGTLTYFDEIDLSGNIDIDKSILNIDDSMFIGNSLWATGLFNSRIMPNLDHCGGYVESTAFGGVTEPVRFGKLDITYQNVGFDYESQCLSSLNSLALV